MKRIEDQPRFVPLLTIFFLSLPQAHAQSVSCGTLSNSENYITINCEDAIWFSGNLTIDAGKTVSSNIVSAIPPTGAISLFGTTVGHFQNNGGRIEFLEYGVSNFQSYIRAITNGIDSRIGGYAANFFSIGIANTNRVGLSERNSLIGNITNIGTIQANGGFFTAAIANAYVLALFDSRRADATSNNVIGSITNHRTLAGQGDGFISAGILNGGINPTVGPYLDRSTNRIDLIENYSIITGETSSIGNFAAGIFNGTVASSLESPNRDGYVIDYLINRPGGVIAGLNNDPATNPDGGSVAIGIFNSGVINRIDNDGQIFGLSESGRLVGIFNAGTINNLNNNSLGHIGGGILNSNGGSTVAFIQNLNNAGRIVGTGVDPVADLLSSFAINNTGGSIINNLTNESTGSIINGIGNSSSSTINYLSNLGEIQAGIGSYGIVNAGTIGELNNAQGGTQPLTYSGPLPTNYNVIIYGPSSYGKLEVSSPGSSITNFGIYSGSRLSNGTYGSVIKGITSLNLGATTGTYGSANWTLINSSADIWDLLISGIVLGPSTADTQQSLVNTASVLQGTFTLQNSVMVNGFTYDCSLFDKQCICVSAGGRNTTVQAQGINNTSGLLITSYRLNKNNSRIGAWVDQNLSVSGPGTVQLGNSTPMIGLFGVWSQRPDGVGAEVKVSAAYGQKDTTITRQIVGSGATASEAGSGSSQLISQGAQVVAKYGFAVMPDVVVSPYAGVRYTQNNMGGYTEATSSSVTAPLTYSALNTNATTALAGAEARYRGIPKTTLFASAGVETDTNTSNGSYSATGVTGLTPVNFNPNPVKTRPTATVGGYYDIMKNQRIGITGIYRQEPFQAVSTTTVLATYTIGL